MSIRSHVAVPAAFLLLAACAQPKVETAETKSAPPPDAAAVQQQIEAANAAAAKAWQAKDTANCSSNYAPEAIIMMPNEPAWVGADKIHAGMVKFVTEVSLKDAQVKTENVMLSGDMAVETGSFEWTLQPKTGKAIHDKGKYLTVWKQQADGSWKIVRDINNSDLPAS